MPRQMTLMSEPGLKCNLADWHLVLSNQIFCSLDSTPNQILVRGYSSRLPEQTLKMRDAQSCHPGDVCERDILVQVGFNVIEYLSEFAIRQSPALHLRFHNIRTMEPQQACGNGHRKTVHVNAPAGITALHLRLKRPRNILQLWIAHLKPVSDFYSARVQIVVFCDGT